MNVILGCMAAASSPPWALNRRDHLERGRHTPWPRRVVITALVAICLLGLLGVFGQRSAVSTADASGVALRVDSPERLRGGLIFTTVITVTPHRALNDAQVVLSPDWFNGMTLNAFAPQPGTMGSDRRGVVLDYGRLDANQPLPIWISWQVNPTTVGGRTDDVSIWDGDSEVVSVHRDVAVFP